METNKKTLLKVPIVDLQKKYDGRAFNMQINNTGDQPVRVRLFGNGQTFAEVMDLEEQGGEQAQYVRQVSEMPSLSQGLPEGYQVGDTVLYSGETNDQYITGMAYTLILSESLMNLYKWELQMNPLRMMFCFNEHNIESVRKFLLGSSGYRFSNFVIFWNGRDYEVSFPQYNVLHDPANERKLRENSFYEVNVEIGIPTFEYIGTPLLTARDLSILERNNVYDYCFMFNGGLDNSVKYNYFAKGHLYQSKVIYGQRVIRDVSIPVFEYYDTFRQYAVQMNVGDMCCLLNFRSYTSKSDLQEDSVSSTYMLTLRKLSNNHFEFIANEFEDNINKGFIGYGLYTVGGSQIIGDVDLRQDGMRFSSYRLFSLDKTYNDIKYLAFQASGGPSCAWIPETIVLGQPVDFYADYDEEGNYSFNRALSNGAYTGTFTGNKATWNNMGSIGRMTDKNGNSFPFDFKHLKIKSGADTYSYVFTNAVGNEGSEMAYNVRYGESDSFDADLPLGICFKSVVYASNFVNWSNIRFENGCANISIPGDRVSNFRFGVVKNLTFDTGAVGSSTPLQNVNVLSGDYKDGNDQPQTVTIDRGRDYETTVGLTSLGQVQAKNLMD